MRLLNKIRYKYYRQYVKGYREAVLSLVDYNPNSLLIDLGCGDASFTSKLMHKVGANKAWGVDRPRINYEKNIDIIPADLNKPLPIEPGKFDVVCASQIIEHLSDTDTFLEEIHRILKPNGYLIISTNNLASWHNIFFLILGMQPPVAAVSDGMDKLGARPRHRRIFTFPSLCGILEYHGFKVERVIGSSYYPLPTSLAKLMCRIDKRHSACINIRARRV